VVWTEDARPPATVGSCGAHTIPARPGLFGGDQSLLIAIAYSDF